VCCGDLKSVADVYRGAGQQQRRSSQSSRSLAAQGIQTRPVCMYVYMNKRMYIYMHACLYVCIYVYIYIFNTLTSILVGIINSCNSCRCNHCNQPRGQGIFVMCVCVAVCCSVLQCVAVCCSMSQQVTVCCRVLQCMCCSVM